MSIDREHRDMLVEAIDRYLHDELTAFEFDDAIFDIRDQTHDETVKQVVDFLWCYYDDCDDHKVVLDRANWNCIQRLRLLLKSDATLHFTNQRIWSVTQFLAAIALAFFVWVAYQTGIGEHLLVVAIPFGVISIALSKWRWRLYYNASECDYSLYPFTSLPQILCVRHGVPNFHKERYPTHLTSRRIRGTVGSLVSWLHIYPFWMLYSPVVLLAQLLPVSVQVRKVVA
jgi:hypothetical protein